ncbi:MAG: nucleotidyl transferase AbiEii/AbiGii toxin family protein [Bdellovibrionales bacterium]|nr:nucleotidyl transferase AbiEii/AbiGii toxin family protein [Bdellovibrionales bacterium]
MIRKVEITEFSKKLSFRADIVEKDYVLGWLLAGISAQKNLSQNLIFKGGTCLKKCHLETHRLSEDLDYTVLDKKYVDEDFLISSFKTVSDWVYEKSDIEMPKNLISFRKYKNKKGIISVRGKVGYRGPLLQKRNLPKIQLDITASEILVLKPVKLKVHHPYSDEPKTGITAYCYSYVEAFAEKIRALGERARPRDLYDIVCLLRNKSLLSDHELLLSTLKKKSDHKKMEMPNFKSIKAHKKIDELGTEWESMLAHQLPLLPPLKIFWRELPSFFEWLNNRKDTEKSLKGITKDGELWESGRMENIYSTNFILEKIKFSALNRLCVELLYEGKKATIEPYSFRKNEEGHILFYGCHHKTKKTDSFKIEEIQSLNITVKPFTPKYVVEIG